MTYDLITRLNQTQSPLLHLPAELRNKIYEYALSGYKIECGYPDSEHYQLHSLERIAAVCYTCHQIRSETGYMQFALNTFCGDIYSFTMSAQAVCHPGYELVRCVQLRMRGSDFNRWTDVHGFGGLEWFGQAITSAIDALKGLKELSRIEIPFFDDRADPDREEAALMHVRHEFERNRTTSQDVEIVIKRTWDEEG